MPPVHWSVCHVKLPHVTLVVVLLWSAWQSVFAFVPEHVRPVVSFVPLIVIDEYVPVSALRNVVHASTADVAICSDTKACENVTADTHFPPLHTGVLEPHVTPQPPQLFLSDVTSVHVPLHSSVPTLQHLPCVHHSVDWHAVVQLPQWSWKFCGS